MLLLCFHNSDYNICNAYVILTQDAEEELNQNNNDMPCITGSTGITGTTFYNQHTRFDIPVNSGMRLTNPRVILI